MTKQDSLTMCWFGFFTPYATSIVHVPEQVISPKEIAEGDLIFIWDKYMKSDVLTELIGTPVPWSPALIQGYSRDWTENEDGSYECELVKNKGGQCLGAVLLISRLKETELNPLIESYENRGYSLKKYEILIGDLMRTIPALLP